METIPSSWIRRINIVEMSILPKAILPKAIYAFSAIPIPIKILLEARIRNPKFCMEP